ncbi:hypothetical protein NM208_g2540 [Fusarium decemcellulare]|uniref:Uncharacterized protein n=2 Tax=Fusarium decemcellulare TaxID=57161 RepID=A0ACC1SS43_9HYPO|nr:hypothetical protein NM208_g3530 [Fusarium decemcellulare]KAJ3545367.1 hypothetical protein NM208_g2540 [Fusarium decemcellulare]
MGCCSSKIPANKPIKNAWVNPYPLAYHPVSQERPEQLERRLKPKPLYPLTPEYDPHYPYVPGPRVLQNCPLPANCSITPSGKIIPEQGPRSRVPTNQVPRNQAYKARDHQHRSQHNQQRSQHHKSGAHTNQASSSTKKVRFQC